MPKLPSHVPTFGGTEVLLMAPCKTCQRVTVWLVFEAGGRLCLGHSKKSMTKDQIRRAEARARERQNPRLF